jgi:hypothetical protein
MSTAHIQLIKGQKVRPELQAIDANIEELNTRIGALQDLYQTQQGYTFTGAQRKEFNDLTKLLAFQTSKKTTYTTDVVLFDTAADAGLAFHTAYGGPAVQNIMMRLATLPNRMIQLRAVNKEIAETYLGIPAKVRKLLEQKLASVETASHTSDSLSTFHEIDEIYNLMTQHHAASR